LLVGGIGRLLLQAFRPGSDYFKGQPDARAAGPAPAA